jgi:hypothetical protein
MVSPRQPWISGGERERYVGRSAKDASGASLIDGKLPLLELTAVLFYALF